MFWAVDMLIVIGITEARYRTGANGGKKPAGFGKVDWDVVCGGTLGIIIGCALAQLGW